MKEYKLKFKRILFKCVNFYVNFYALIDIPVLLLILSKFPDDDEYKLYKILIIALCAYEGYTYWKRVIKSYRDKRHFFAAVAQNNVFAIYGGTGTGKSTLAKVILNRNFSLANQYHNTVVNGSRIFTHDHLFLKTRIDEHTGTLLDEAGRMYDSFKYEKKYNDERLRVATFNKFFEQFNGRSSMCIYVDQAESNLNTVLYRTIYYVVVCKSLVPNITGVLPWLICQAIINVKTEYDRLKFTVDERNKLPKGLAKSDPALYKRRMGSIRSKAQEIQNFNPFSMMTFELMDFNRTGEYADHYSINKDDKSLLINVPALECFSGHNTRVFKDYNPALEPEVVDYWGTDEEKDRTAMINNFNLDDLKQMKEENNNDGSKCV